MLIYDRLKAKAVCTRRAWYQEMVGVDFVGRCCSEGGDVSPFIIPSDLV